MRVITTADLSLWYTISDIRAAIGNHTSHLSSEQSYVQSQKRFSDLGFHSA